MILRHCQRGVRVEILALDKDTAVSGEAKEIYENAVDISRNATEVANTAEFAEAEAGLAPETLMQEKLPYDTYRRYNCFLRRTARYGRYA